MESKLDIPYIDDDASPNNSFTINLGIQSETKKRESIHVNMESDLESQSTDEDENKSVDVGSEILPGVDNLEESKTSTQNETNLMHNSVNLRDQPGNTITLPNTITFRLLLAYYIFSRVK